MTLWVEQDSGRQHREPCWTTSSVFVLVGNNDEHGARLRTYVNAIPFLQTCHVKDFRIWMYCSSCTLQDALNNNLSPLPIVSLKIGIRFCVVGIAYIVFEDNRGSSERIGLLGEVSEVVRLRRRNLVCLVFPSYLHHRQRCIKVCLIWILEMLRNI